MTGLGGRNSLPGESRASGTDRQNAAAKSLVSMDAKAYDLTVLYSALVAQGLLDTQARRRNRKEVKTMNIKASFLSALLFIGIAGTSAAVLGADDVLLKEEVAPGSNYCHMQFPAIRKRTLNWDHPILKSPGTGDIIDYYGSCDENPLGKDQVWQQRVENFRHRVEAQD
jgi:hypothetical protein